MYVFWPQYQLLGAKSDDIGRQPRPSSRRDAQRAFRERSGGLRFSRALFDLFTLPGRAPRGNGSGFRPQAIRFILIESGVLMRNIYSTISARARDGRSIPHRTSETTSRPPNPKTIISRHRHRVVITVVRGHDPPRV